MDLVSPVLNFVSTQLWDPMVLRLGYIVHVRNEVMSMNNSMDELRAKSLDLKKRVRAAEAQLQTPTHEVRVWLDRVDKLEEEVKAIQQKFEMQSKCLCSCRANLCSSYRIGKDVARKTSDVKEMLGKATFETVATRPDPEVAVELPSTSAVGVESLMEEVSRYLSDDITQIVGIHGMGGVGKSTLMRNINNINNMFIDRKSEFDHVIMVEASPDFQITQLQREIAKRIRLISREDLEIKIDAKDIFKSLKNKKLLLLLDNLWERIELTDAGIPVGQENKCKVVITSRDESVLGKMGARTKIKVECLSPEKAWELFKDKAGKVVDNPEIKDVAKSVAEECRGLPLALVVIAAAMSAKTNRQEWQYVLDLMKGMHLDRLIAEEESPFSILKLSYDFLKTNELKLCFLSCSLYPEGRSIYKEELIECWMGLGLLKDDDYNEGHFVIGKLLREASLLEEIDEDYVKMHDVIRGLALHIIGNGLAPQMDTLHSSADSISHKRRWVVRAGEGLTKLPNEYLQGSSSIEMMSLMDNQIDSLLEKIDFPILLSLILGQNYSLKRIPSQGLFDRMRRLKYLDLSWTSIEEVNGIDQLILLEYLNLSNTNIHELPEGLRCLKNLRYLYLQGTQKLRVIPHKLLSSLDNLRVFYIYISSYNSWATDDCDGSKISSNDGSTSLSELDGLIYLKALGISVGTHSALQKIFSMSVSTRHLFISDPQLESSIHQSNMVCWELLQLPSTTQERSKICTSLLELTIENCQYLEELAIGEEEDKIENIHRGDHSIYTLSGLEYLYLGELDKLSKITWKGVTPSRYFPNIRLLSIVSCDKLKSVSWVLRLPCLENLDISNCTELQQVIASDDECNIAEGDEDSFFPKLKQILLRELPELTSIYGHTLAFPSLESIRVFNCPKLTSLPFGEGSARHLKEICGNGMWWNNFKWRGNNEI